MGPDLAHAVRARAAGDKGGAGGRRKSRRRSRRRRGGEEDEDESDSDGGSGEGDVDDDGADADGSFRSPSLGRLNSRMVYGAGAGAGAGRGAEGESDALPGLLRHRSSLTNAISNSWNTATGPLTGLALALVESGLESYCRPQSLSDETVVGPAGVKAPIAVSVVRPGGTHPPHGHSLQAGQGGRGGGADPWSSDDDDAGGLGIGLDGDVDLPLGVPISKRNLHGGIHLRSKAGRLNTTDDIAGARTGAGGGGESVSGASATGEAGGQGKAGKDAVVFPTRYVSPRAGKSIFSSGSSFS